MIHTFKGFSKPIKQMFSCNSIAFSVIQWMLTIWSLVPLPVLNPAWTSGNSQFTYYWSLAWRILSIILLVCAAAAAESLQSCPTLCDPIDGSPPGSPVPGILQARLQQWTMNFRMFTLGLEKAEEPEIKLSTSTGSQKKQESSRKTYTSALLTTLMPLTVSITIVCGKFLKRREY